MNLIKQKLRVKKKTIGWLAQRSGVSKRQLIRIIKDNVDPLVSTAYKISKALDCTIEEVFLFED